MYSNDPVYPDFKVVKQVRLWPWILGGLVTAFFLWLIHTPEPKRYCDEYTVPACIEPAQPSLGPNSPLYGPLK